MRRFPPHGPATWSGDRARVEFSFPEAQTSSHLGRKPIVIPALWHSQGIASGRVASATIARALSRGRYRTGAVSRPISSMWSR